MLNNKLPWRSQINLVTKKVNRGHYSMVLNIFSPVQQEVLINEVCHGLSRSALGLLGSCIFGRFH